MSAPPATHASVPDEVIPPPPALPAGMHPPRAAKGFGPGDLQARPTQPSVEAVKEPDFTLVRKREEEPRPDAPIVYREYAYAVKPGTDRKSAEVLLWLRYREVCAQIADRPKGKFIQLAVFDHVFEKRPMRPPIATLAWKDWRGDPVVQFVANPAAPTGPAKAAAAPAEAVVSPAAPLAPAALSPAAAPPPAAASLATTASADASVSISRSVIVEVGPEVEIESEDFKSERPGAATGPPMAADDASSVSGAEASMLAPAVAVPPAQQPVAAPFPAMPAPEPAPAAERAAAAPVPVSQGTEEPSFPAMPAAEPPQPSFPAMPADEPPPAASVVTAPEPPPAPAPEVAVPQPSPVMAAPAAAQPVAAPSQESARRSEPALGRRRKSGEDLIGDLFELMHELHFMPDIVSGSEFVLRVLALTMPCELSLVHVFDINTRQFVLVRVRGPGAEALVLHRTPDQDPLLVAAMRSARALRIDDASSDSRYAAGRWELAEAKPRSAMCGGVKQGGRYLGAVELVNPEGDTPFFDSEANALDYICEQFAEFLVNRPIVLDAEAVLGKH